ncbi:hypothetical protein FE257_007446 [Aspergillus nanangensis]|uniref:N-acetylgalactosaminide beta-1,3-galactosyltransferase n=1 Tax=Aspergillus nanangensis TaxID=2582783 RepID=A0AAD4CMT6_ASPNN|nr:hypothetical protein FE257_007446 [Aspergillus nanangensis]
MMISRRAGNILLFIGTVLVVSSVLRLSLRKSPLDPSSLYHQWTDSDPPDNDEPETWDWETTTRFSPARSSNDSSIDDAGFCDSFPSYLLPQIQVVLKIGASESPERLDAQLSTVTRCITNLLIVSDRESQLHGHRVHDILAALPQSFRANTTEFDAYDTLQRGDGSSINSEQGWRLDRFKFLPMVERAHEINPTAQWFVFLESDTYFVWDNVFRLLDQFDPTVPLYFGSPSPGHGIDGGGRSWFAYGGAGFILSRAAVERLVERRVGAHGEYIEPPLSQRYEATVKADCCGDSVLGWALYEKGVILSGLWPMFNPHPLHGIPFEDAYWCQPVISLHKSLLSDMRGLIEWEHQREDRTHPVVYADLFEYLQLGTFERKPEWDNGDWGGFQEPGDSTAHTSFEACRTSCHAHSECLSYTYDHSGHCVFVRTMRLGANKPFSAEVQLSAGWDTEKIQHWRARHQCGKAEWMKPSLTRIF